LLEKQEDLLYEEYDKFVEVEKSLALAMKKNELLYSQLSSCHVSISCLESRNVDLNARIKKLNVASSSLEHVSICNRCKDFGIDACNDHVSIISKLNDDIVKLHAQLKTCKDECDKIKFARNANTIGRHPSIKDELGFHKGAKNTKRHKVPIFIKKKWKAPMASDSHSSHDTKNHAFIYVNVKNDRNVHHGAYVDHVIPIMHHDAIYSSHATIASSSSSHVYGRPRCRIHVVFHAPKDRSASHGPMLFRTFYALYVLYCKNSRVVASNVGPKCKKGNASFGTQEFHMNGIVISQYLVKNIGKT
jgi:hypothetical protein